MPLRSCRGDRVAGVRVDSRYGRCQCVSRRCPLRFGACRHEAATSGIDVDVANALVHTPDAMRVCVSLACNRHRAFRVDRGINDFDLDITVCFDPAHNAFAIRVCCFERKILGIDRDIPDPLVRI